MKTKILVATHKNYEMPSDKNLYLPIFVGKELHPDVNHTVQGDNTGDNISEKNSQYNELTALYWGWKNLTVDAIGLVHYRRYLSMNKEKDIDKILNQQQVDELLKATDIILPKKRHYFIETNLSHYNHAHPKEQLELTRQVIIDVYPEYLEAYDLVMKRTSAHMFNMMIMKKDKLDTYCAWLFDVLGEIEQRLDISNYDKYQNRVYGFISELLLDVWLEKNNFSFKEVKVVHLEGENWIQKGSKFLLRKFGIMCCYKW